MDYVTIMSLIASSIAVYIAWRKAPHEARQLDSASVNEMSEAFERMSRQYNALAEHSQMQDQIIAELKQNQLDLRAEVEVANKNAAQYRDWAERLVHQVQSLGVVPVALVPKVAK